MLGNRQVLTPSAGTLNAMFGDDAPIGDYAKNEFNERISKNLPIEEKIKTICDYAKDLNRAQSSYSDISPWGGLDITVQQVDEIALNTIFEMYSGEELQQACRLLRNELNDRNIKLIYVENIINSYRELQGLPQKLKDQYADYQLIKADYEKRVRLKALEISEHGASKYLEGQKRFDEIQRSPLRRFVGKIPWTHTYKELKAISDSMELALSDVSISEQNVIDSFFTEDEKPIYSAPHYWTPINSDNADMKVIETEADLNVAVKEIQEQLQDPKNKAAYERCVSFSQVPVDSPKEKGPKERADDFEGLNVIAAKKQHETHSQKSKHREADLTR